MVRNHDFEFPTSDADKESRTQRLQALRAHWDRATLGMENRDKWFENKIVAMHSEPGRFYHTLVHLEEMLGFLEFTTPVTDGLDYKSLVLTIFFHDIVYDPKSAINEEDSAQLFQDFWKEAQCDQDDRLKSRVLSNILATKHHNATEGDACTQLLLDMDMAVLGKTREAYWTCAALIRREYAFVEYHVYCEKRAEVLQGFLECTQIYGTKVIRDALETRARDNLKAEIESLQKGHIPE
jgi:predicted metal-dependent HD superfamily phosphohydrolase